MGDNRCVRIYDLKQKIKYHPEVGTYISEEDIDLMERVLVDGGDVEIVMTKQISDVLVDKAKNNDIPPPPKAPPLRTLYEGFKDK